MKNIIKKYGGYIFGGILILTAVLVTMIHPQQAKSEALELKTGLEEKMTETETLLTDVDQLQADLNQQNEEIKVLTEKIAAQKAIMKEHQEYIENNTK